MKALVSTIISAAMLTLPVTASAQNENIRYRSIALEACDVEGYGGWPDYQSCTEDTYQSMVYYGAYPVFYSVGVPNQPGPWLGSLGCFAMNHNNMCHISDEGGEPN